MGLVEGSLVVLPTFEQPEYRLAIVTSLLSTTHQITADVYVAESAHGCTVVSRLIGCGYTPEEAFGEGVMYRFGGDEEGRFPSLNVKTPTVFNKLVEDNFITLFDRRVSLRS